MQTNALFILIVHCLFTMHCGSTQAKDWPQWGGSPTRNMVSHAENLPMSFNPGKLETSPSGQAQVDMTSTHGVKWAIRLGSHTYGNTVVADGRVYVGTNDASFRDPRLQKTRGGLILCLDEQTGATLWQLKIPRFRTSKKDFNYDDMNLGICASVAVDGKHAYVVSNRGEVLCLDVEGQANGLCYAFKALTGPAKDDTVTLLETAWSCDCNPPEYKTHPYQRGKYRSFHSNFYGEGPSEIIGTPVFVDNRVYVTIGQDTLHGRGRGALTCINATNGQIIWQCRDVDRSLATVSVANDLVYVTDYSGHIHCLDAQTGKPRWKQRTESPLWSSTLVADGKVFVGTEKRDLWIMQAGHQAKELNRIRFPHRIYNTPIVANGVMYIATERYLYAIGH